jgi:hypothetical protein
VKPSILLALLLVGCTAPPAWLPGDPPLSFYTAPTVEGDKAWAAIREACGRWRDAVGLSCRRETVRAEATVDVTVGPTDKGFSAWTYVRQDPGGWQIVDWEFRMVVHPWTIAGQHAPAVLTHEIGHLLGVRGHLSEPGAVMFWLAPDVAVTGADVDAVLAVWGMTEGDL